MSAIDPQPVGHHPTAQRLTRNRTTMQFRQLLSRKRRAKVGVPLAHDRHRQRANLSRKPMIAGPTTTLGQQAGGAILFEVAQQAEYLTPAKAGQGTGISDPQPA